MTSKTPIISVVGKSDVGKTTLLTKLLPELKRRGYRVATIKHDTHGFDIDRPGKDTWRHAEAGANVVVISSPTKMALIEKVDTELPLDAIAERIHHVDLIITEGYKRGDKPKIEVHRAAVGGELLCTPGELLAVATDEPLAIDVPCYDLDDAAGLVDLIEARILAPAGRARQQGN
ncbi:P-loop containing nucleoside triphosphate hydrolase [Moorella glycerini]|uniref:Molybdopterin-guanine dinucleotide biosynthesis adapter protein n=1 Tax=Neomoorella stamsii TaxID=1266720 RepID=A0A9X7P6Y7_9FIRM|nr:MULTISPECIES: molybdopterin-guanine dinucleotide biosynthesis protein B [Moorella]PRR75605.1 Molybdopterin-guanine dinucleotide biosynthesis adapter protein [Moorella stamsii]CEP66461.1 P-loop containing nucleoside triphosphate hydrolase [Moorella glycerini]